MRLLAHRTSRRLLDRGTYLRHTADLLTDPQPDIVRTALRAVSHAGYLPAVRVAVDLLEHPDALVRRAADAALVHYGLQAASALTHAMARARPDRRQRYAAVLDRITTTYRGSDT
jgi:HEAT repeat protein